MRRLFLVLLVALPLSVARADALTLKELIELNRSGVGDEVLVALIEVERSVFAIDHETIKMLKAEGLSERVMIAMIKSGRTPAPTPVAVAAAVPDVAASPAPQVIVIEHRPAPVETHVREVAVPVYVPVTVSRTRRHTVDRGGVADPPPNLPIHLQQVRPARKAEPEYWGWGGKLRPDAWKPAK